MFARLAFAVLSTVVLANAAFCQAPPREPWKWTLEQRLSARFSSAAQKARVAQVEATDRRKPAVPSFSVEVPGAKATSDVIDGDIHPELLLPTELFEAFVRSSFVSLPDLYPRHVRIRSDDVLRVEDDWVKLAALSAEYISLIRQEHFLLEESVTASRSRKADIEQELERLRAAKCGTQATAFRAVRNEFGRERFDRFLYTVTASGRRWSVGSTTPEAVAEKVARLRRRETECQ